MTGHMMRFSEYTRAIHTAEVVAIFFEPGDGVSVCQQGPVTRALLPLPVSQFGIAGATPGQSPSAYGVSLFCLENLPGELN